MFASPSIKPLPTLLPVLLFSAASVIAAPPPPKAAVPSKAAAAPAVRFRPAELDLAPGEQYPVEVFFPNHQRKKYGATPALETSEGLTLVPDNRGKGTIPRYGLKLYPKVRAAADASGEQWVEGRLAGLKSQRLAVRIVEPELKPIPGDQRVAVRITNPFRVRPLTGRIVAANPNRFLQNVTARLFRIEPGSTGEVVFPLPGAAAAPGETYEFTFDLQTYQGYRKKHRFDLEFPPLRPGAPLFPEG